MFLRTTMQEAGGLRQAGDLSTAFPVCRVEPQFGLLTAG
jgi:hypothetical protein